MDNEWKWQQENVKLQHEVSRLRRELAAYKVGQIPKNSRKRKNGIFTKCEMDFIRENGLSHDRVYRLTYRLHSVQEALIEAVEEIL
ncbi:hypothetical protein MKY34_19800 [Sporosarcina sp. FSL K6-1522]|uniref:hypothetical protein n=1 Tax=Sporosarcina sp. FSL K6-1522 TaxID=2921554 RepID=UPI00315A43F6